MPTLTISEREVVNYDFRLYYDANFIRLYPMKIIRPRSILRCGTYAHSMGTAVVSKNQRGEAVHHISGNRPQDGGAFVEVYVKMVEEPKIPEGPKPSVFSHHMPLRRFTERQ